MRRSVHRLLGLVCLALSLGCSSTPLDADEGTGGTNATSGGKSSAGGKSAGEGGADGRPPSPCSAALRQSVSLVDAVSSGAVSIIEERSEERVLYVDASAGGLDAADKYPWVYVALASGGAVQLTDLEALESTDWDLAFKRSVVRTNGGDSGPGEGGAIRLALAWDSVDGGTLGTRALPTEQWFDDECNLVEVDTSTGNLITTFSGWSEYDQGEHVLSPADAVYITAGADGALYKLRILDYYSNPNGTRGSVSARYKIRVAPLP